MLVLNRRKKESFVLGFGDTLVTVSVVDYRNGSVRLGIQAPQSVFVHRQEVYDAIRRKGENPLAKAPDGP